MNPPITPRQTPPGVRKLSEVLVEFAQPFLAEVTTQRGFEMVLGMAIDLWNIGALPPEKQGEALWRFSEKARQHPALPLPGTAAAEFALFVERRRTQHAGDRRIVTDFKVEWEKGEPILKVVSFDLAVAERETKKPSAPNQG